MSSENKLALIVRLMIMDSIALTLTGIGIAKLQVNLDILPDILTARLNRHCESGS